MRVNIYSQELTSDIELVTKESSDGKTFSAVRFLLHSSPMLHQPPDHTGEEDDRSGITVWLPKSDHRREEVACMFERLATMVREAPSEDG